MFLLLILSEKLLLFVEMNKLKFKIKKAFAFVRGSLAFTAANVIDAYSRYTVW